MKIAILAYEIDDASGSSLVAVQQATLLARAGNEVTFFTLRPGGKLTELPVETLPPPLGLPLWRWQLLYPLVLLPPPLNQPLIHPLIKPLSRFDAVIAYDYPFSWLGYYAKRFYGLKYIWFLQGVPLLEGCEYTWEKIFCWMQTYGFYRWSAANADVVVTETDFLREALKDRFGMESMVIPNPSHLSLDLKAKGDDIRRRYQLGDEPLILYVDRLDPSKGVETLLDSFTLVRQAVPRAKLMLIGRCRKVYWQKIRERLDESTIYIEYVPHDEIAAYYAAADIFATCALWEAEFSHTILEAQAMGKPAVAFSTGAHPEVIRNEETGILVDRVGDAGEFASALVTLLNNEDLARSMGQKAISRAKQIANKATHDLQALLDGIKD